MLIRYFLTFIVFVIFTLNPAQASCENLKKIAFDDDKLSKFNAWLEKEIFSPKKYVFVSGSRGDIAAFTKNKDYIELSPKIWSDIGINKARGFLSTSNVKANDLITKESSPTVQVGENRNKILLVKSISDLKSIGYDINSSKITIIKKGIYVYCE